MWEEFEARLMVFWNKDPRQLRAYRDIGELERYRLIYLTYQNNVWRKQKPSETDSDEEDE